MRNVLKPISILAAGLLASSAARADNCTPVEANIDTQFVECPGNPAGLCTAGTIASGPLKGTTFFEVVTFDGQNYTGVLTITTDSGTVTIADKGSLVVNPDGTIDFSETDRVTGGTRKFKSGQLTSQGMGITVSGMLVGFSGTITGQVCAGRSGNAPGHQ